MMADLFSTAGVSAPAGNNAPPALPKTAPFSNETTSKEAAQSLKPDLGRIQKLVFDFIAAKPSTAREVEDALSMRTQTVTARIRELVLAGRLEDSGEKRTTDSGRKAIVWRKRNGA